MTAITVSFPLYPPVSILFVWGKSLDYLCPHQVYGNLTKVSHWKVLFSVAKEYDLGITPPPPPLILILYLIHILEWSTQINSLASG